MRDLNKLRGENTISLLQKKNLVHPFEDVSKLEHLSKKYDASLFFFGSHTKKRPQNLIFGRMFNNSILDMLEFEVKAFKSMQEFVTVEVSHT